MGTRNVSVIKLNGKVVLTKYCQWDGYPTGVGLDFCNFIKNDLDLSTLKKKLSTNIVKINNEQGEKIFDEYLRKSDKLIDEGKYEAKRKLALMMVPALTRDTNGADLLKVIQDSDHEIQVAKTKTHDLNYAKGKDEYSFCLEYCYEIDLDKETLKVYNGLYRGRNYTKLTFDEIKLLDVDKLMKNLENEFYGNDESEAV